MYSMRCVVGGAKSSFLRGLPKTLATSSGSPGSNTGTPEKIGSPDDSVDFYQGRNHEFSASRSRDILDYGHEHSAGISQMPSSDIAAQGIEMSSRGEVQSDSDRADILSHNGSTAVSLNSCMQSNVPEPFNAQGRNPTHVNMPGGGILRSQKYVYGDLHRTHPSRQFSTSSLKNAVAEPATSDFNIPCPQGIQGDDCVRFKIWYENCRRLNLSNCDEQLSSLQSGRKTLAQVFAEQDALIREVVQSYEKSVDGEVNVQAAENVVNVGINRTNEIEGVQGLQDVPLRLHGTVEDLLQSRAPCPEGIQGSDCERFRVWLKNCSRFGIGHCDEQLGHLRAGRKTLSQIFQEQDQLLEKVAMQYRSYSTGPTQSSGRPTGPSEQSDERH